VGAVGSPGDRIQLAPLLRGGGHGGGHGHGSHAGSSTSPVVGHSSMPPSSSTTSTSGGNGGANGHGASTAGYPVIELRSGNRPEYSAINGSREREGRDDQRRERDTRDVDARGGNGGKKNPLSIGSIVSDNGR
jgi:hypothetical protein